MKLRARIHGKDKRSEGVCNAIWVPSGPIQSESIMLDFEDVHIFINANDFLDFAREILGFPLYNKSKENKNVRLLR